MSDYFTDWAAEAFKDLHYGIKGRYSVGERVTYISLKFLEHETLRHFIGCEFTVGAVNVCDDNAVEYLLDGFPFFVWEHEIESCLGKIKQECTYDN